MQKTLFFVAIILLAACSGHEPSEFEIEGLSKAAVLQKLGKPRHQTLLRGKQISSSMGPKPQLARSMADDDTVEMWSYRVTEDRGAEVFFNEEGLVAEVIIFRTDVMY